MKILTAILLSLVGLTSMAQHPTFDNVYNYIENINVFGLNQVEGHTVGVSYPTVVEALNDDKWKNKHVLLLNGTWKFHFANTPEETPKDFFADRYNDKAWSNILVPSNWEMQGFGDPLFRNVAHPFHSNPPFVPREYNPTGAYRKSFTVPANWNGKRIYLRMEKTASASFVWVNGQEVGYNEGAQEPAEYDITEFVKPGKNLLAVKVMKYSDGVYLESQDYWRLAGIFDDVWLYAKPNVQLFDWYATTDLDDNYENATLNLQVTIKTKPIPANRTTKFALRYLMQTMPRFKISLLMPLKLVLMKSN
jgi:beta-galactosidase